MSQVTDEMVEAFCKAAGWGVGTADNPYAVGKTVRRALEAIAPHFVPKVDQAMVERFQRAGLSSYDIIITDAEAREFLGFVLGHPTKPEIEVTTEMVEAGRKSHGGYADIYRAMADAAPKKPNPAPAIACHHAFRAPRLGEPLSAITCYVCGVSFHWEL